MKIVLYEFTLGSTLDDNLYAAWKQWEKHTSNVKNWTGFVRSLPGVADATYYENYETTEVIFKSEEELSMFLLRWS